MATYADWRAPFYDDLKSTADWYWYWRYVPCFLNVPGAGPDFTLPEVAGKWTGNLFNLTALSPNYRVFAGGELCDCRWWLHPFDTGNIYPPVGLARFGTFWHSSSNTGWMFYVRSEDDFNYNVACWAPDDLPGKHATWSFWILAGGTHSIFELFPVPYAQTVLTLAGSIAPDRRPARTFFPPDARQLWSTSLSVEYGFW